MTDKLPVAGTPTPGGDGVPSVPEAGTPYGPLVPYGDVPHGGGEDQGGIDYRRYIAAVLRYKWAVIAVTVLGTAAGVGATRAIKPEYVAQATLWVETTGRRDG
ncbi:MAG: hypothetical protein IH965_15020, partial [Gemmatimonadetes bacterium]|nr:hypothetical protein [Gemmatimonadota bacterium]